MSIDELAARLKRRAYTADHGDGFVVDQVRRTHLLARFVERVHRIDEVLDPFGNPEKFERFEYRSQEFRVSRDGPQLEFIDLARNARTLVTRLLEIADFDLVVEPISVDPWRWAADIQSALGHSGIIDRVQAKNVQIGPDALASVQINAKTDALEALRAFTRIADVPLDKVRVRLPGRFGTFTVSSSAGIELSGMEVLQTLEAARKSLIRT